MAGAVPRARFLDEGARVHVHDASSPYDGLCGVVRRLLSAWWSVVVRTPSLTQSPLQVAKTNARSVSVKFDAGGGLGRCTLTPHAPGLGRRPGAGGGGLTAGGRSAPRIVRLSSVRLADALSRDRGGGRPPPPLRPASPPAPEPPKPIPPAPEQQQPEQQQPEQQQPEQQQPEQQQPEQQQPEQQQPEQQQPELHQLNFSPSLPVRIASIKHNPM
jgi:hypothetical protein